MKLFLFILTLSVSAAQMTAQEARVKEMLKTNDTIVWVGLDYSLMRMIGNSNSIRVPDLLLQDMPAKWNDLFLDERIENVARALKTRIAVDLEAVTSKNKKLSTDQVVLGGDSKKAVNESHITPEEIAKQVRSYKLRNTKGVAAVFIIDRFVYALIPAQTDGRSTMPAHTQHYGAVHVVFFDVATREVISKRREVRDVGTGGSFRNFWFGPIKDIDADIGRYRP